MPIWRAVSSGPVLQRNSVGLEAHSHFQYLGNDHRKSEMKTNPNVLFRRLANEIVLFNLETDRFYELNGTAARFWELLHEGQSSSEIRQRLLAEFSVNPQQLDQEAAALVDSLRQEDLITNGE